MSTSALFILTDGLEELEAVAPLDILRRSGVTCITASQTDSLEITGRNDITLRADHPLSEVSGQLFDMVVIPGGPGVAALRSDPRVLDIVKRHSSEGLHLAAICAAPTVLKDAGVLENRAYTAHFTVAEELPEIQASEAVVVDGKVVTSRGAGTAVEFGLKLAEILVGTDRAREVAESIHYQTGVTAS